MSQEPVTVTYSLEDVLTRLEQTIDKKFDQFERRFEQFERRFDQLEQKVDNLQQDVTDVKIGQARTEERLSGDIKALDEKVNGLSKRLDNQEFVNRGILVALVVAILGSVAKLLGWVGNP